MFKQVKNRYEEKEAQAGIQTLERMYKTKEKDLEEKIEKLNQKIKTE